jgi:hypothetical protein
MSIVYRGSKVQVYNGTAKQTGGGLVKADIIRIKDAQGNVRYKSKVQQKNGKKKNSPLRQQAKIMSIARKELIDEGIIDEGDFVPIGGTTKKGKALKRRMNELSS